ncbi:MAG: prepilin-type N-terminal cleavage/methylation domain-containing protein [Burkholderiaceae bacterium]|jgi:type IV pilus assembly protein PilW|nr:prepilin-type N-terminal cleavage/methylation domain-containing protein [Burkholderiaceae bacterium]
MKSTGTQSAFRRAQPAHRQSGISLIELLVGITIGLLVVAVAAAALIASKGVTQSVSDNTQLQQQASYLFRIIGQQIRQSGSIRLNLAANKGAAETIDPSDVVAFSPDTKTFGINAAYPAIGGSTNSTTKTDTLTTAYQNYFEPSFLSSDNVSSLRDCLGKQPAAGDENQVIQSNFSLANDRLMCSGLASSAAALADNVSDFQVRYLVQTGAAAGQPKLQKVAVNAVSDWSSVFGVEVCLVMYGTQKNDIPKDSKFTGCDSENPITIGSDNTNLASAQKGKIHMTFRNVYLLRSQGLI